MNNGDVRRNKNCWWKTKRMNNFYSQWINQQLPPRSANTTLRLFLRFCILKGDSEQSAHYLKQHKSALKRFRACTGPESEKWVVFIKIHFNTGTRICLSSIKFGDHKTSYRYKNSLLSTTRQPKQRSHQIKIVICAKQSEWIFCSPRVFSTPASFFKQRHSEHFHVFTTT